MILFDKQNAIKHDATFHKHDTTFHKHDTTFFDYYMAFYQSTDGIQMKRFGDFVE